MSIDEDAMQASRLAHPSGKGRVIRMGIRKEFGAPVSADIGPVQNNTPENLEAPVSDPGDTDPAGTPGDGETAAAGRPDPSRAQAVAALVVLVLGLAILTTGITLWVGLPAALTTLGAITIIAGFLLGRDA